MSRVRLLLSLPALVLVCACSRPPDSFDAAVAEATLARTTGPRVSGGFAYAPCQRLDDPSLVTRFRCAPPPSLLDSDGFRFEGAPRSLHDAARWHLLFEGPTGAARADALLAEAALATPDDARLLADRSAARELLAELRDDPSELVQALDLALRAAAIDPQLSEAAFNAAWLLDRLHLRQQAHDAWQRYAENEPGSGWAEEADRRVEALTPRRTQPLPENNLETWVAGHRQEARERSDELLGRWASAVLAGTSDAETHLRSAEGIARRLAAAGGDRSALDACREVRRAMTSSPAETRRLARGHRARAQGIEAFANLEVEEADRLFGEASRELAAAGGPTHLWAEVGRAGPEIYRNDGDAAEARLRAVLAAVGDSRYPALAARARWGLGLVVIRRGRFSDSLRLYREALAGFERAGETANRGALHTLIAENLRLLGYRREAWEHRLRAARLLSGGGDLKRQHNALREAAQAASEEGLQHAALAIQDEGVDVARRLGEPATLAEALLWRSKIQLALDRPEAALNDLLAARGSGAEAVSPTMRRRLEADLLYAEAEAERRATPGGSLPALDRAVAFYRRQGLVIDQLAALLSRARARRATGRTDLAEADLSTALALAERQRIDLDSDAQRRAYAETTQQLFDAAIALSAERPLPAAQTLELVERARRVERTVGGTAAGPADLDADLSRLRRALATWPAERALIVYAWLPDRLLVWLVHDGRTRLTVRPIVRRELADRIDGFVAAVRSQGTAHAEGEHLHRLLMPAQLADLPAGVPLFVVPDRSLHALPFAALRDPRDDRSLIADRAVAIAPSVLELLDVLDRERSHRGRPLDAVTLVADPAFDERTFPQLPRLQQAGDQVHRIADLYRQADELAAAEATRGELLAHLGQRPVLHFAGHAVGNALQPSLSHLVLADDGDPTTSDLLFARDIEPPTHGELRLVVLSACETIGTGKGRIDGLTGLARSFLDAGASAVVGTLWPVEEDLAGRLTLEFHRQLQATGNAAEALRRAQLTMQHQTADDSWSVFQLVGAIEETGETPSS